MKGNRLVCIKGLADDENLNVICLEGDYVKVLEVLEGEIIVEVLAGWMQGLELSFTPEQLVKHFKIIGLTYNV